MEPTCWTNQSIEGPVAQEGAASGRQQGAVFDTALTYVSDAEPGIRRLRKGTGFSYRTPEGRLYRAPSGRASRHLSSFPRRDGCLISPDADGHIQATGRINGGASSIAITHSGPRSATARNIRALWRSRSPAGVTAPDRCGFAPTRPASRARGRGDRLAARQHDDPGRQCRLCP